MITLDRLKLVTSANYVTNLNQSFFLRTPTKSGAYYYKYHQDSPFLLTIIVNPQINELVVEFSGKILQGDYPKLISRDTIRQCFDNINNLGLCLLDIDSILCYSNVCLCDVTKDVLCSYPMQQIKTHLKASIINYDKWIVKKCQNNGLAVYNSVTTKRRFKRFIIYDKAEEMKRAGNRSFLSSVENPSQLLNQFSGKIRVELNLRSMEQVRNYLQIPDNDLQSVLESNSNPILSIWDEAINETTPVNVEVYNKTEKLALLKQCNFDLQAVEMKIREHTPKTSSIRRKMEPYRQLLQSINSDEVQPMNIRELLQ